MKSTPTSQPSLGTLDLPFQSKAFLEAWADWKAHRKELKKPLGPTAEKYQLRQIAKWKEQDAIASIEQSVRNGWQGLFEVKANGHQNGNGSTFAL